MTHQTSGAAPSLRTGAGRLLRWWREALWSRGLPPETRVRLVLGWPLLLLPLVCFGQLVTPHPVWVVLIVALIALYLSAHLWIRTIAAQVTFRRQRLGSILVAGDLLEEEFLLSNASRLPIIWAEFIDESNLPGYIPGSVVACGPGGEYRWRKEVVCAQRGVFRLGPHRVVLGELFGLFEATTTYARSESLLIYPRVVQLPAVELPRGSSTGSAPRRRPLLGVLPAASVREYAQGDSLRNVHWPSTAHRERLMVKELELEPSGDVWIVLDLDAAAQQGAGRTGTLEVGVMLAASLAAEMVSGHERRAAGLLLASGADVLVLPPQPGPAQLWAIMAALAPANVTPWTLAALLQRNRTALGRRHTLIVITPNCAGGAGWIPELVSAQSSGLASSVVLVTQPDQAPAAEETAQQLHRLDIPVQLVRTDLPLRPALTYRRKRKVIRTTPTGGAFTEEVEEEVG